MKHFLLIISMFLASCINQAKEPFLGAAEVAALSKNLPECKSAVDNTIRNTDLKLVDVGVTANKMAVYLVFANETGQGLLVHLASPGYDWTLAQGFAKSEYKGACKTSDGKFFLVYEMKVESAKQEPGI